MVYSVSVMESILLTLFVLCCGHYFD